MLESRRTVWPLLRRFAPMHKRRRLRRQNFFVVRSCLHGRERRFRAAQHGEKFQETFESASRCAPVLPVVVGAHELRIEPNRACSGLAHLGAGRCRDQRRGQRKKLRVEHPAAEIDAVDDVAPLIGASHLQHAAIALVELDEVIGLQDHVMNRGRQPCWPQPQRDGIEERCGDGKMRPTSRRKSCN